MKTQFNSPATGHKDRKVLLTYWFISNKHNQAVFEALQQLQRELGHEACRIVCLNPFNSAEDIAQYCSKLPYAFEFSADQRHTALFYQIYSYPTCLLMEASGRILHRQDGFRDELLLDFEAILRKGALKEEEEPQTKGRVVSFLPYKPGLNLGNG